MHPMHGVRKELSQRRIMTTSSLQKYLSNFPYFTGFPVHSLVK